MITPYLRVIQLKQGSDLSPDLFNVYTADIPKTPNTVIAIYADDTA